MAEIKKGPSGEYDYYRLTKRLAKYGRIDKNTGCWLWPRTNSSGYGSMVFEHFCRRYEVLVHRISAWIHLGYDGNEDLEVCHNCNMTACFNPGHLYIASHQKNMMDAYRQGRLAPLRRWV